MYKYLIKSTNPLKALWGGEYRFLLDSKSCAGMRDHFLSSDWNYKCGLYLTK